MLDKLADPKFAISSIFDGIDFSTVYFVAALAGALLALYVMMLWSRGSVEMEGDCWFARHSRRIALAGWSLAMLWSLAYATTKGWQPWPPYLLATIAVDAILISIVIVAFKRKRALG